VPAPPPLPSTAPALYGLALHLREGYTARAAALRALEAHYSRANTIALPVTVPGGRPTATSATQARTAEPCRRRGAWDALLEEMGWLAADVYAERRWKVRAAKVLADEAMGVCAALAARRQGRAAAPAAAGVAEAEDVDMAGGAAAPAPAPLAQVSAARARCLALESVFARSMAPGDAAAAEAVRSWVGCDPTPTPALKVAPFVAVAAEAAERAQPLWAVLRRAVFAAVASAGGGAPPGTALPAGFPLTPSRRDGLAFFRPPGLPPAQGEGTGLNAATLGNVGDALCAVASAWVSDGQGRLGMAGEEEGASPAAVTEALLSCRLRLRASQALIARRILCAWLLGAPAVLEGWASAKGLGRTSVAAAAIAGAHARAAASGGRASSTVVCAPAALTRWRTALSRFAPGLVVSVALLGAGVSATAASGAAVRLVAILDSTGLADLPGALGTPSAVFALDQRGLLDAKNVGGDGTAVTVQSLTRALTAVLPASTPSAPSRLLITAVLEELPQDEAPFLAALALLLLPGWGGVEGVRRLALLGGREGESDAPRAAAAMAEGSEPASAASPAVEGGEAAALTPAEVDAAVVSTVNKAVWLLYVDTRAEPSGTGRGVPGGSPNATAGPVIAPVNAHAPASSFGGPHLLERTVQTFATPVQSAAQARTLRVCQARAIALNDRPSRAMAEALASTFKLPLAGGAGGRGGRSSGAIEDSPPFPTPGLPDAAEIAAGVAAGGSGPTPSQSSPGLLRLLASFSAVCQSANAFSGWPSHARPEQGPARLAGSYYGAVNSFVPRSVACAFESEEEVVAAGGRPLPPRLRARVLHAAGPPPPPTPSVLDLESIVDVLRGGRRWGGKGVGVGGLAAGRGLAVATASLRVRPAVPHVAPAPHGPAPKAGSFAARAAAAAAARASAVRLAPIASGPALWGGRRGQAMWAFAEAEAEAAAAPLPASLLTVGAIALPGLAPAEGVAGLTFVGPHPVAAPARPLGRARIAQAVEPSPAEGADLAHRMLLRSGKLRALSSILAECSAFGHTPLLLCHSAETTAVVQSYLDACGAPLLRLDGGTGGPWPASGPSRLAALSGVRRGGFVALACCAPPPWLLKLPSPRAVAAGVEALLGPCASLDGSLVDVVVVVDWALGLQSGALLDVLLDRLRYGRGTALLRLRATGQLEEVSHMHLAVLASARASGSSVTDLPPDVAVVPRVLQSHVCLSEAEIAECAEALVVFEARARLAGPSEASGSLAACVRMRAEEAVAAAAFGAPSKPPACSPASRHASSAVGQALFRRAARVATSGPRSLSYTVPGPAGGDVDEEDAAEGDVRAFGHIDANSGRHVTAPGLRPAPMRSRRVQRRMTPSMRGVVDVLAAHQDRGGSHFSHSYGPPNPTDRKVSLPPSVPGDRSGQERMRAAMRVTQDVLLGVDYLRNPTMPPASAMTAPAGPMPWRVSATGRRAVTAAAAAAANIQREGARAGGPPPGPPSTVPSLQVPGVASALRIASWTRLTSRANAGGEVPFTAFPLAAPAGEAASNAILYSGPGAVSAFHDPIRKNGPAPLAEDIRLITALALAPEAPPAPVIAPLPPAAVAAAPVTAAWAAAPGEGSAALAPPSPEAAAPAPAPVIDAAAAAPSGLASLLPSALASILTPAKMPALMARVREAGAARTARLAVEGSSLSFVARKRFHEAVFGRGGLPALKRSRLALGVKGEGASASEILRLATRDGESDGLGPQTGPAPSPTTWTTAEDTALLNAVAKYGSAWGLVSEALRGGSVARLLPSGSAYTAVVTTTAPAVPAAPPNIAPTPSLRPVSTILPLVTTRTRSARSMRALITRFRAWVSRPVTVSSMFALPSSGGSGRASTSVVATYPAMAGSARERASVDLPPTTRIRGAGPEISLAVRLRSDPAALPGRLRPVLTAGEVTADAPTRPRPVRFVDDSVKLALEVMGVPPEPVGGTPHPSQRTFLHVDSMAARPPAAMVAAQPLPAPAASAAAAAGLNGRPEPGTTLASMAGRRTAGGEAGAGGVLPPSARPLGPPAALVALPFLPQANPFRSTASGGSSTGSTGGGSGGGGSRTKDAGGTDAPAPAPSLPPAPAPSRPSVPSSDAAAEAAFTRIAAEALLPMAGVLGKSPAEFLPWLRANLSAADKARVVAIYTTSGVRPEEAQVEVAGIVAAAADAAARARE